MIIKNKKDDISKFTLDDIELKNYNSHNFIVAKMKA